MFRVFNRRLGKPSCSKSGSDSSSAVHPNNHLGKPETEEERTKPIKVATFNAAHFSMAPALPNPQPGNPSNIEFVTRTNDLRPIKGILKPSPLHPNSIHDAGNGGAEEDDDCKSVKQQRFVKSRLRVSINLPDNEISLRQPL